MMTSLTQQVDRPVAFLRDPQRFDAVRGAEDVVALRGEDGADQLAHDLLVLDHAGWSRPGRRLQRAARAGARARRRLARLRQVDA